MREPDGNEGAGPTYVGVSRIEGPIAVVSGVTGVAFDEMVELVGPRGDRRRGRVLEVEGDVAVVEVFEGTSGLNIPDTRVRFLGHPVRMPLSREMLGRIFDPFGRPLDGGPPPLADEYRDIGGLPINPTAREYPTSYIETGVSAIDGLNTLVRGQKLPIFSGSGLPHNELAAQIARQARISAGQEEVEEFAIVFAAMGVSHDVATFFRQSFQDSGALHNSVLILNLADDPPVERIIAPRAALTLAEYLAFDHDLHVLAILTNMTDYASALREISAVREEVPGRKGYPGYLYSDFASIYERSGRITGKPGSITQVPILTMPNDDITDPVPDLTGFISEGQIVLSRELYGRGVYPPIDVLPSLSRLMKDGIGKGHTRPDHPDIASQLYAAYARSKDVRALASIIGEEELTETDRSYLRFGETFEKRFVTQGRSEARSIADTLDLAWEVASVLPREELHRVSEEEVQRRYRPEVREGRGQFQPDQGR
ncbi:MAG: V-type ATP synthase subunit B [Chloroflexota bacterium]